MRGRETAAGGAARAVARLSQMLLWRSPDEIVIDKPAGLPSETPRERTPSVLCLLRGAGEIEARLPHRLDAMTSGVLVVALSRPAAAHHGAEITAGRWRKLYIARLPAAGRHDDSLLGEHVLHLKRIGRVARVVRAGGSRAISRVLAVSPDPVNRRARQALIEIETGRYHQIRATLAHLGVPLIGDEAYGGAGGEPMLDHAALRMTPASAPQRWFRSRRSSDATGPVAPRLMQTLDAITPAS